MSTTQLMPSERICLKRTRPTLIQSLDVTTVLPRLRAANLFTADEERLILADPRRRERAVQFLAILEKKTSETFKAFCNELEEQSPHLYLVLSDWDKEDSLGSQWPAAKPTYDDDWSAVNRCRQYLLTQIDGAKIVPLLRAELLTPGQRQEILSDPVRERRTEMLLEMLEMKSEAVHHMFVEAVGELYPHVYLELTGKGDGDDDW
jgi:antitoxin component of MazEF toxin-antitoxin module